jgi:hypothetical protein
MQVRLISAPQIRVWVSSRVGRNGYQFMMLLPVNARVVSARQFRYVMQPPSFCRQNSGLCFTDHVHQ